MDEDSIYATLGVPTVINAAGTKTRVGGSLLRPEAVEATAEAAGQFVRIADLQATASDRIAEATGAEAGYVTAGAAAGLELSAAACIAGTDPAVMAALPATEGVADEIVMPRTHRTGYDHALRAAGAAIVDVGTNDPALGTGAVAVEPWELDAAITDRTAAVAVVQKEETEPPLETVVDVAHENDVPVIADAAAELPPTTNLSRFVATGADLVVFSGGKAIRGPQSTGIVAGREKLIASIAAQQLDTHAAAPVWEPPSGLFDSIEGEGVPRQGIGRSLKVGQEELVGLLRALELFIEADHDALHAEWRECSDHVADSLQQLPGVDTHIHDDPESVAPEVVVSIDSERASSSATELVSALRAENPRVFLGADDVVDGQCTVNPMCLQDGEVAYVLERIEAHLAD